jgi:hypothetical protein
MVIEEMTRDDCFHALARARLGRLACARDNQPYVIPFYFAFREPYLYAFTTFGQKVEWMRENPLVCVEVDEVDQFDRWTSVIIFGRYEELRDTPEQEQERHRALGLRGRTAGMSQAGSSERGRERQYAHNLLQQYAGWWETGHASHTCREPAQSFTPIFYRILIDRISGRRAMPDVA